jgi:hypothetical protein
MNLSIQNYSKPSHPKLKQIGDMAIYTAINISNKGKLI